MSDDYPKVIDIDGLKVTVADAVEEAMWTSEHRPPQGEAARSEPVAEPIPDVLDDPDGVAPTDPLDDVSIEMDDPSFQPPTKTANKKK